MDVINSTVSGNDGFGGIFAFVTPEDYGGRLNLTNSTVTGNSTAYDGGGIACAFGNVTNSTISGNSAANGGGTYLLTMGFLDPG